MDIVITKRCVALAIVLLSVLLRESTATPVERIELLRDPSGFPSSGFPPTPPPPTTRSPPTYSPSTRSPSFNRPSKIERDQLKNENERPSDVIYLIENLDPKATNNISDVLAKFKDAYNVSASAAGGFDVASENKTFEMLKEDLLNNNDTLKSVIIPITLENSTISGGVFRQNQRRSRNLLKAVKGLIENGEGKMQYSGGLTASQSLKLFGKVFHAVVHITYGKPPPEAGSVEEAPASGSNEEASTEDSFDKVSFSPTTEKELFEIVAGVRGYAEVSQAPQETQQKDRRVTHDDQGTSSSNTRGTSDTYECNESDSHDCENRDSDSHESENQGSSIRQDGDNSFSHDSSSYESDISDKHHSEYRSSDSNHSDDSQDDCHGDSEGKDSGYSESEGSHENSHSDSGSEDGSAVSENLNSYSDSGSVYISGSQSDSRYDYNSDEGFAQSKDTFRVDDGLYEQNKNITTSKNKTNGANKNSIDKNILSAGKNKIVKDQGNKKVISNKNSYDKDREGNYEGYNDGFGFPPITQAIPFINGSYIDDTRPNVGYYNIYNEPNLLFEPSGKFRVSNKNYLNFNLRRGNGSQDNTHNVNGNKFDLGLNFGVIPNDTISRTNNKYIENIKEKQDNTEQNSGDQTRGGDDNDVSDNKGAGTQNDALHYHKRPSEFIETKNTNDDTTEDDNNEDSGSIKDTINKPNTNTGSFKIKNANVDTIEHNSEENVGSGNDDEEESGNGSSNTNLSKPNSGSLETKNTNVDTTEHDSEEKSGSGNDDSNDEASGNNSNTNTDGSVEIKKANVDTTEHDSEEKSGSGNDDSNDEASGNNSNTNTDGSVEIKKANVDTAEHDSEEKSGSGNDDSNDEASGNNSNTNTDGSVEIKKANVDTAEHDSEEKSGSGNDDSNDEESGNGSSNTNSSKANGGSLEKKNANDDTTERNSEEKSGSGNASNDIENSSNDNQNNENEENKNKKIIVKVDQNPKHTQADTAVYKRIALRKKVIGIKGGKGNVKNYIQKQGHQIDSYGAAISVKEAEGETRGSSDIFNNNGVLQTQPQLFSKVSTYYPVQRQHKESVLTNSKRWFATEKRNKYLSWNDRLKQLAKISNVYV